ncbi:unnamed protein product, partial [Discosporangium mesarthrocarpum]
MECSNVGTCSRDRGACICPPGYTGSACQRLECPNNCSGKGLCATLSQAAEMYGMTRNAGVGSYVYSLWDADMSTMCVCDWGYTGADCSLRLCPKGDDPLTTEQNNPRLSMVVNATSGVMEGTFTMWFQGEKFDFSANATSFSSSDCEAAFEDLSNIEDITCIRGGVDSNGGATYTLELVSFPTYPHQNNIFYHDGWPTLDAFSCDPSNVTGASNVECSFVTLQDDDVK